jgi:hypothetical protein
MALIASIKEAWGWTGLDPLRVVGDNDFGNLMVEDQNGRYWRICPEDLYCRIVVDNRPELDALSQNQDFLHDWYMTGLVAQARKKLGPLRPGDKFCLKIPGVLGGEYGGDNLGMISLCELILASGHIAKEIADLPDDAKVRLVLENH